MNKFTEVESNTIIKRILEGRLNYYDETIIVTKNLSVVMDAVAYIEQLRIELKEKTRLLKESYELIQIQRNEVIETCALIVCPEPQIEEERECHLIATEIRRLKTK